jgi:glycosyltransferase involved in cell wall biosynthesis
VDLVFNINKDDSVQFRKSHSNVLTIPHWSKFEHPVKDIKKDPKMILFVGRLNESNKGFEHLYHLPEGLYEIHCVGNGDITMRSDMIHHTNISDNELMDLYLKASLLVVPSRYEAFSYVSIEALMCNTPIVISDRVRIADYLQGN